MIASSALASACGVLIAPGQSIYDFSSYIYDNLSYSGWHGVGQAGHIQVRASYSEENQEGEMPKFRDLGVMLVIVAALTLTISTVASAHRGHRLWPARFDLIWIDHRGADAYTAAPGHRDHLIGLGGDDVLAAGDQRDLVQGGVGNDSIDGGEANDMLLGGVGDDTITGGDGRDIIRAGRGDDTVLAADGRRDWVRCGPGVDSYTADRRDRVARNCENRIQAADLAASPVAD